MRSLLSLVCAAVLLGPALAQDATKDANLYPLKKGSKWTYTSGKDTVEVAVTKTEKIDKVETHELITSINNAPMAAEHVAVRADGLYRVKIGPTEVKPPVLFLKFGAKKGDTWKIASAVGPENLTGEFVVGETEVEWDKKKHKAITVTGSKMTANGQPLSLSYTFLEGVGLFAQSATLGGSKIELALTKYEPGKE